ncbi:MAG: hypothetical protein M0P14_06820 [Alkaliphilus sp.]|nr:hypothetical protein [Alkaliphilus sp.]
MDFRTILAFIIIAFISSLFNKNKTPTKPTVKTDEPVPREPAPLRKVPDIGKNKDKKFFGGFEDLFKEVKLELDKALREAQKGQASLTEQGATEEDDTKIEQKIHPLKGTPARDIKRVTGSVYEGEIGREERYIKFDKKSVVRGVIMSEVLQKPKSLRR